MLRKTILTVDWLVSRTVAFLCLPLFLICLYATVDAANVYMNANDTSVLKFKPTLEQATAETLHRIAEDAVAWFTIDDTSIDYPLMQGSTNETYLNRDPFGNFSLSGSIFLDSRNSAELTDPYSLVYGHHMDHGAMFGSLDAFYERVYFLRHRTGTLVSAAGQSYELWFFACAKALASEPLVFDPTSSADGNARLLRFLEQNAAVYEPEGVSVTDRIIAFSTCQGADSIERLILFGVLRELPVRAGAR